MVIINKANSTTNVDFEYANLGSTFEYENSIYLKVKFCDSCKAVNLQTNEIVDFPHNQKVKLLYSELIVRH